MLFNSFEFALFFPVVFVLYWIICKRSVRLQNIVLLLASYFFYSWWDYRFAFLLLFSTALDYYTGLKIHHSDNSQARKTWLIVSVVVNLGFLAVFKYYNFFIDSFSATLESFGMQANLWTLQLILPVGISFYTFHGLSYVFDTYNRKFTPTRNFVDYAVFVSFFPLLVAGPIERATHLLPQVQRARVFTYERAVNGMMQILWGLFKKVVIADNCADVVNTVFNNHTEYNGITLVIGAVLFAFQIYGDFSGYSDIALGAARILGFDLIRNFAYPYFSRDIAEFWRRWHISLSSWFKDYLYIPLGGNRGSTWIKVRNTCAVFIVSGFWHGANWTFIVWGMLHALYFIPLLLLNKNRSNLEIVAKGRQLPTMKETVSIVATFAMVVFAWIFFRAESVPHALSYISGIFSPSLLAMPQVRIAGLSVFLFMFMCIEWFGREEQFAIAGLARTPLVLRWGCYMVLMFLIILFGDKEQSFIYFQF